MSDSAANDLRCAKCGVEEPSYVVGQLLPPVSAEGIKQAQKLARGAWKDVQP